MASSFKSLRTSLAQNREKKGRLEEQLRVERQAVRRHESDIEKNKDFTYTVDEQVIDTEKTEPGYYNTVCTRCNMTCHENCPFNNDQRKQCPAMDNNGYCKMCFQNCHWSVHRNQPFVYVIRINTVTKTADDFKNRYEEGMQKKAEAEILVTSISKKLEQVNDEIDAAEKKLVILFTNLNLLKLSSSVIFHCKYLSHRRYGFFSDYFMWLLFTCACVEGHIYVGCHL